MVYEDDEGELNAQQLKEGLDKHKQTTKDAEQAVKLAEQARASAADTMVTLKGQGEQMKRIQGQYDELEYDVDRAESLLDWLGRCCWCCNCCRPEPTPQGGWGGKRYKVKKDRASKEATSTSTAQATRGSGAAPSSRQYVTGNGLDGEFGEAVRDESRKQNAALDQVADALEELGQMGQTMKAELAQQKGRADDLAGHTEHAGQRVKDVRRHKVMRQNA